MVETSQALALDDNCIAAADLEPQTFWGAVETIPAVSDVGMKIILLWGSRDEIQMSAGDFKRVSSPDFLPMCSVSQELKSVFQWFLSLA